MAFDNADAKQILQLWDEAERYLRSQPWLTALSSMSFANGFEHVGVFFAKVTIARLGPTDLWVVCGDLPPLYLDTDGGSIDSAAEALDVYSYLTEDWIEKAEAGNVTEAYAPIVERFTFAKVAPTAQILDLLRRRIKLLREKVIPWMKNRDAEP